MLQLERALEKGDALVDLVTAHGELSGSAKPRERIPAKSLQLGGIVLPNELRVLGAHRLRIVVGEKGGVSVPAASETLKPAGEAGVQPRPPRPREGGVRDLTGQRVLEPQLPRTLERRPGAGADEIALLEQLEAGHGAPQQLANRFAPEGTADHGGGLQRLLLERR